MVHCGSSDAQALMGADDQSIEYALNLDDVTGARGNWISSI
jgi:hypothetical protein